ncbi:hypothetical protein DLAC_00370 [Tieghemostelium lacteum]|uniref:Fido domain-containing protein n=1 Tax=Tieghemostelium lacteum TaxID=361077 RepID=A0A152A9J3_TIELA|nr:hypothetical protein DLAC_00370 [Tieghemostelium lacteum]|eukprot:KYR02893.1 hypothetical protein DLAC_00370 [Tieghemostelium lacteum]
MIRQFIKHQDTWEADLNNLTPKHKLARRQVIQHYIVLKDVFDRKYAPLSVEQIKNWHRTLMKEIIPNSGDYRKDGCMAGMKIFPEPTLVSEMMDSLVKQYNLFDRNHFSPYAVAAWLSHAFVSIHPFSDGNGRLSRLLGNYVMFSYGFPYPTPISNVKRAYMKALRLADRDYSNGRDTSHLAFIFLENSNMVFSNYLANKNLTQEFK